VSSAGVHIAGNFQSEAGFGSDWQPNTTTMTLQSGNIYAVTVSLPDGIYEYKFINDSAWGGVESVPSLSQVGYNGNDNRWVFVQGDTTMPAVQFGGDAPVNMKAISMIVNLENESTIDDTISVAGNLQGWTPGATRMALLDSTTDRFHYIHYDSTAAALEWKFVNGTSWGLDESVPSTCASNGNRFYNGTGDTIYDVCFAQCMACFIPDTFDVTLNVDMNATCGFDPASDSVDIAGPFNSWSGGDFMIDPDGDGIYSITKRFTGPQVEYKARFIKSGSATWEGGGNNVVQISSDTTLGARCFGFANLGACAPKPPAADVTLEIDMTQYAGSVTLSDVYVMGDFTDPAWQPGALKMNASATKPGVFELTLSDFCPGKMVYKFVVNDPSTGVNGSDVLEESFSGATDTSCLEPSGIGDFNRFFIRPDGQPQTISTLWQSCTKVSLSEQQLEALVEVFPNPAQDKATITLPEDGIFNVRLTNLTGQVLQDATQVRASHDLKLSDLPTGVYIINLSNEQGVAVSRKLIVE